MFKNCHPEPWPAARAGLFQEPFHNMKKVITKTHQIDATNQILGRLATKIAFLLQGKDKVDYRPYQPGGNIVEVTNVDKIKVTGRKLIQKTYYRVTGYPGGIRTKKLGEEMVKNPAWVLRQAVLRMLPKNRWQKILIKHLKIQ